MIGIISMLGGEDLQENVTRVVKKYNCEFITDDCRTEASLLEAIQTNVEKTDVIVIHQLIAKSVETILPKIREITKSARIVLILVGSKKQFTGEQLAAYKRYCFEEDFIFEDKGIDAELLRKAITRGRIVKEESVSPITETVTVDTPAGERTDEERPPADETETVEIDAPADRVGEVESVKDKQEQQPKQPKQSAKAKQPKTPVKPKRPKHSKQPAKPKQPKASKSPKRTQPEDVCYEIAVFGTTRGAGVTNMVYTLAEFLALNGKKVLALNLTDEEFFQHINGKADYMNERDIDLFEAEKIYDIIIHDAGTPFKIGVDGMFKGMTTEYSCSCINDIQCRALKDDFRLRVNMGKRMKAAA